MSSNFALPPAVAAVAVHLLKGVVYRDQHEAVWQDLLTFQGPVREYLDVIGLQVFLDESEGYAFLRQRPEEEDGDPEGGTLPRLVQRRQLSYPVSLLCVLLRKRLVEQDAAGGETRVILSRAQIVDMMRVFLPPTTNEAKLVEQIDRHVNKVTGYGFLRRLKGDEELYEVRRIIKALVDAEWLSELDEKLTEYKAHADGTA